MYVCARAVSRTLALSLALSRITPNQLKMHKKLQKMQNTWVLIHNNALYIYIHSIHPINSINSKCIKNCKLNAVYVCMRWRCVSY
jgi:hypothetical protein